MHTSIVRRKQKKEQYLAFRISVYMTSCFSCIVVFELEHAKRYHSIFYPINLNKSSWSSSMVERQERRAKEERLFKSRWRPRRNGKRKLRKHWREWPGKERRNRSNKEVKKKQLKSPFINAVSIHYRCIYAIRWGIRYCLGRQ